MKPPAAFNTLMKTAVASSQLQTSNCRNMSARWVVTIPLCNSVTIPHVLHNLPLLVQFLPRRCFLTRQKNVKYLHSSGKPGD